MFRGDAGTHDGTPPPARHSGGWWDRRISVAQLTKMSGNVALAEFVVLARRSAFWQWRRGPDPGCRMGGPQLLRPGRPGPRAGAKGMELGLIAPGQVLLKVLVGVCSSSPTRSTGSRRRSTDPPVDPAPGRRPHRAALLATLTLDYSRSRACPGRRLTRPSACSSRCSGASSSPSSPSALWSAGQKQGDTARPADAASGGGRRRPQRPGDRGGGRAARAVPGWRWGVAWSPF